MADRNVLGGPLEPCGPDPLTGFYRDGCCSTGEEDLGRHTICAVVTSEFLEHQRAIGNDLSTPMPVYHFAGLTPGDRWCVTAAHWLRLHARARARGRPVRGARRPRRRRPLRSRRAQRLNVRTARGPAPPRAARAP